MKSNRLSKVTKKLVQVAQGSEKASLVIKNAHLINVNTAEIIENIDIAITEGRIAMVGNCDHCIGAQSQIIDASGLYASPTFMDGHMHVESSMMTVTEYAKAVIPHGTGSIFADPHEMANVLGKKGIDLMSEEAKNLPFRFFLTYPSCVPAAKEFEDSGASITELDIQRAMQREDVCGLGELMNYVGVLHADEQMHNEIAYTLDADKIITGHYSASERGSGLNAYIATGARCCHESVSKEDALAKMRLGMYAQIREGSAWQDLKECIQAITKTNIDTRFANLVTDDAHPNTILKKGHLDYLIRYAIKEGVPPIQAIQMVTINVAQCFNMQRDLGSICPGKYADIVLFRDLKNIEVHTTIINGQKLYENGTLTVDIPKASYPDWSKNTMHINDLKAEDFLIQAPKTNETFINVNCIKAIESKSITMHIKQELPIKDDVVLCDVSKDIAKLVVIERHHKTGSMGKGFVSGFSLNTGAIASTVSHDAHNLIILGTNDQDMAIAGNELGKIGGGMIVVKEGKILAKLSLNIAGLMSEQTAVEIAEKIELLDDAWKELGCTMQSPFMTMALLSLSVIPHLRLTNRGLVDSANMQFIDLFAV